MRSKEKFSLIKIKKENGHWVKLCLKWWHGKSSRGQPSLTPSLEDLYRIIRAICECEDEKYPDGRGRYMFQDFLQACCVLGMTWEELSKIYLLPERTR